MRDKLGMIRQKVSVADYCAEFDTLLVSLPDSYVRDFVHAFIYGLKANLHTLAKAQVA